MPEMTGTHEQTSEVEETSEELRWRMEKVVQQAAATQDSLTSTAEDFNKALAILSGQGDGRKASDQ